MKRRLRLPLRNAIERFRPDLILGAWMYPDGCAVSALAEELDLPCFLIAQGTDLHSYLKDEVRKTKILRSVDQSITTITRSRSLEALLTSAGADSNKVRTIYNGVDTTLFRPGCREAARAQLGISEDISLALFVGNLLPVKNPELLLHALAQMKKPPLLLMVGDGPLRSRLSTLANDLKIAHSVRLTGRKSPKEVSRYMHAADVLCLSSHNEGLPNVILEAFASGLPVVATNVGGVSEVVNSPILGTLVTPGNPHEFSQALEARLLMRTDREAISKTGADYSWNRTCDLYLETFNRFPDKDFLTTKQQSPC
jgi:glycosyltransferase involved in cell wall biosynthesis